MIKVLAIDPYLYGTSAAQRFRIGAWAPYLEKSGVRIDFLSFCDEELQKILYTKKKFFRKIVRLLRCYLRLSFKIIFLKGYHVVFLSKQAALFGPPILEYLLRLKGIPVIYDFDDAIFLPREWSTLAANKFLYYLRFPLHWYAGQLCKISSQVTVGNRYLYEFASRYNKNVSVIPTTIDTRLYRVRDGVRPRTVTIGWSGSHTTIVAHLLPLKDVLVRLKRSADYDFVVICDERCDLGVPYRFIPWNADSEVQDLFNLDIGMMPLRDDEWSKGKCGLKLLQYMAIGIPVVASAIGVNNEIIKDGENGFLVKTEEDWIEKLVTLIQDEKLRHEIGRRNRRLVEERYSAESGAAKLLDLLSRYEKH